MRKRVRPTQVWIRGRDEEGNLNPALHDYKSGEEWKGYEEGMDPVLVQNTKMRATILLFFCFSTFVSFPISLSLC